MSVLHLNHLMIWGLPVLEVISRALLVVVEFNETEWGTSQYWGFSVYSTESIVGIQCGLEPVWDTEDENSSMIDDEDNPRWLEVDQIREHVLDNLRIRAEWFAEAVRGPQAIDGGA